MVHKSPFPDLDLPQSNLLSYLFPEGEEPFDEPLWIDSKNERVNLSPKQLLQWVKRVTCGLEKQGLKRGDVVMIFTPNHIFVPVAYLELVHQIQNTTAKLILVHPKHLDILVKAAEKAGVPKNRIFQLSDHEKKPQNGVPDWRVMMGNPTQGAAYRWPTLSPQESKNVVATINYSSGTTGLPKGVMVSHANLIANVEQTIFIRYAHKPYPFHARPQERWIGFLPLYHAYGQLYTILMATRLRVPVYIMDSFRYDNFLSSIATYRITSLQIAPPILVMLSKRSETCRYDLSSVKDVLCGAAPLSKDLQNYCQRRFDLQINQGWGMTEVTCGAIHVPGGVKDDSGSVGRLDPNCEAKLVDDEGKEVEKGKPGELVVRGPNICLGYWRNEKATKECLGGDGWLSTGDVAVEKDSYFWIVDRKKELIKVNALQVAPAELEGVLMEHDAIADAAVVGIAIDNEEFPRAYVVMQPYAAGKIRPEDLQEWIKPRVAKHKQLTGGVVFIDEVPKLQSGKIQRKTMRDWATRDAEEIRKSSKGPRARL
ncbi:putative 4-coumarate- ligase protein [Zalerion maritima]|uniref:4-coumarate- ligase protein n=1 Tax=Zalerion maritima TaxID=339359 RepID=A0AAD5RIW4_9PEZI|nr:putative 4-coumarate- ligase protein [Zalerion maritima]